MRLIHSINLIAKPEDSTGNQNTEQQSSHTDGKKNKTQKILHTEFHNLFAGFYTMSEWDLCQECKVVSTYKSQCYIPS
jgi:hypothetical protein